MEMRKSASLRSRQQFLLVQEERDGSVVDVIRQIKK